MDDHYALPETYLLLLSAPKKSHGPVIRHLGPTLMMIRLNWYLHFIAFYTIEKNLIFMRLHFTYSLGQSFWLFLSQLLSKATVKILDCSEGKVLPHFYTANRSVCVLLSMFFISMGSIECDAFSPLILVVGWKNPRDVLKTTLKFRSCAGCHCCYPSSPPPCFGGSFRLKRC